MTALGSRFLTRVAAVAAMVALSTVAQAQEVLFDWGGDTTSSSGKQSVRFNSSGRTGDIIVSFGDRRLYFIVAPGIADSYPIAIPREQSRWEGVTSVSQKRENPSWTPTPTMMAENPRLPRWVPGGHPMNPLGNRALYLGSSAYRIHGTDAPWTIGTAASKGCIRMFNDDVADLYPRVKVGAKVTVTWATFGGGAPIATTPAANASVANAPLAATSEGPRSQRPGRVVTTTTASETSDTSLFSSFEDDDATAPEPGAKRKTARTPDATAARDEDTPRVKRRKVAERNDAASATAAATPSDDAPAKAERKPKRATAKTPAVAPPVAAPSGSAPPVEETSATSAPSQAPTPGEAIAERAEAAAERAAGAADRAAAAAERVLAAQGQNKVE